MSRISFVKDGQGGLLARLAFWFARRRVGSVPNSLRVLAHHSQVLRSYGWMEMGLEKAKLLPSELKMLVVLAVAKIVECPF